MIDMIDKKTAAKGIALVTGATSGIGAAYARRFAEDGYNLIIHGRREEKLNALARELEKAHNIITEVIIAELSRTEGIKIVETHISELKRLDVLVNNAGYWNPGAFWEIDSDSIEALIYVHNIAPARFIRAALPRMMEHNQGDIINISSVGAYFPTITLENYSATKGYLITLSKALHVALLETGLRIQALVPGFVLTDFHSRLGVDVTKSKIKFMMPEELVDKSLKELDRGKVIYIPTYRDRFKIWLTKLMKKKTFYKIMYKHGKLSKKRWEEAREGSMTTR